MIRECGGYPVVRDSMPTVLSVALTNFSGVGAIHVGLLEDEQRENIIEIKFSFPSLNHARIRHVGRDSYLILDIFVATGPGRMHWTVTPLGAASVARSALSLSMYALLAA